MKERKGSFSLRVAVDKDVRIFRDYFRDHILSILGALNIDPLASSVAGENSVVGDTQET